MNKSRWACYNPRFLLFSVLCAAAVIGVALIMRGYPRGSAMRIALAVVEGLITAVVIVGSMLSLRRLDEMQQRIQFEALALAFTVTGVLATGYGFLVSAGLPNIDWGTIIWPAMVGFWALGVVIASRRYR